MTKDKFHFGATSVMREVPPGQSAVIKFNGKLEEIDTEWGAKMKYPILFSPILHTNLFLKKDRTVWQSNSQAARDLAAALEQGIKELSKAFHEN